MFYKKILSNFQFQNVSLTMIAIEVNYVIMLMDQESKYVLMLIPLMKILV